MEDERGEPSIVLRVRLEKRGDTLALDYTGTAPQRAMPLNAVYGVTLSGVYYAVRAVTDPRIPMNDGSFAPISVHVPEGTLLNPRRPAPVSAGNVETSMRNADLVLGALAKLAPGRVPAQSGGSMNNVMIGGLDGDGKSWAFYETNGCGMGARPHADGIDGIHAHMTNTLNTPIEAIERQMPMLITAYEFAESSAGDGEFRGGSGLVRAFALRDGTATASLLAERHAVRPRGTEGGKDAATGAHVLVRRGGAMSDLPAKTTVTMEPGDAIIVTTAGGGGYGDPAKRDPAARARDRADGIGSAPMTAAEVRAAVRAGTITGPTERLAPDHVQANLVVVPREYAGELADLCARNPVPCPVRRTARARRVRTALRARRRHPRRPRPLSRVARRRAGRAAARRARAVVERSRRVPDRLLVHVRPRARRSRADAAPLRARPQRADVPHARRARRGGPLAAACSW